MAEHTQTTDTADKGQYAWCNWHRGYSTGARLVRIIEAGSGPGASMYACTLCREEHGLVPVADQP